MVRGLWVGAMSLGITLLVHGQQGLRFIENKGQWPAQVAYMGELSGATFWMERSSVVIDRYDAERLHQAHANVNFRVDAAENATLRHHAVRLTFLSATPAAHTTADLPFVTRYNYFLGKDPSRWGRKARAFATTTLHEVAPGIDAVFREGRAGLKYDLVVAPGADPGALRFTYEGADELFVRDGSLIISTSLGRLVERIPIAYQEIGNERRTVTCSYVLTNGVLSLRTGPYDPKLPLIIDPELAFATFSGSVSNNFGYSASFDAAGFLYAGSTAFGNQYPVTLGAYQTTWAGGTTDIALSKYDTTGSFMVWSTYLGGGAAEMPHSLFVDENDQLVVLGTTASTDFPTTTGAYDNSFGGGTPFTPTGLGLSYPNGSDMIVARLSADGSSLLGSTYLGGSGNDGLNSATGLKFNYADEVRGEVLLDDLGRIWVTSCTQSTDIPVTAGAAQGSFSGGSHDGYVARLNPALTQLQYASFIGGSAADAVYAGALDEVGRLYVCGGTVSTDLPATPGAWSTVNQGGTAEAFVARLAVDGSTVEALSYYGSAAYDQAYFVEIDGEGAVYLFGQTSAPSGQMHLNATYNVPAGGQFLAKLNSDLTDLLIGARIGSGDGTPDISPTAFLVDVCDKIYTSGWGSSAGGLGGSLTTTGLPVTPDAHQPTTTGHDLYLAVFDIDMTALTYATYYGGPVSPEHVDGGTSRFDRRGRVYQSVCAGCQNNDDFPTTPGAWSSTNNSSGCNNAVLKFDFDAPLVIAAFLAPDTVCAPLGVPFTNLSSGATGYLWDFGDGQTSTDSSPTHTYAQPGTYTVTLTATSPLTCNGQDIATRTVTLAPAGPLLEAMNDTLICGPVNAFQLIATSFGTASTWHWSTTAQFTDVLNASFSDSTATVAPSVSGTYHVRASNGSACTAQDSVQVTIQLATIILTVEQGICVGDTAQLAVSGDLGNAVIEWLPADEIIIGQGETTALVAPSSTTTYAVELTTSLGCTWGDTVTVNVSPLFGSAVSASADQTLVLPGTTVQLLATPSTGVSYFWQPAGAVSDPNIANPTAVVDQTTTFIVTVSDGICIRSIPVTVTVYELRCKDPDIFVPNTFSPNGDGNNDVLFVRGRHIQRMEFMVFDRWGEKVFESAELNKGWDGTFEGRPVDPAVFVYHLRAWCVDGQQYFTKGNVTVIR